MQVIPSSCNTRHPLTDSIASQGHTLVASHEIRLSQANGDFSIPYSHQNRNQARQGKVTSQARLKHDKIRYTHINHMHGSTVTGLTIFMCLNKARLHISSAAHIKIRPSKARPILPQVSTSIHTRLVPTSQDEHNKGSVTPEGEPATTIKKDARPSGKHTS